MKIKKKDKIVLTYLENNKINFFFGIITKIKKFTFTIEKKYLNMYVKKIFFIKNPNFVKLKKIK